MRSSQKGATLVGWMLLLLPTALLVYMAVRALPVYLNYSKVSSVLESMAAQVEQGAGVSPSDLRLKLARRLDIDAIEFPTEREFSFVREDDRWLAVVSYEEEVALWGNMSLLLRFDKEVVLQ